MEMPVESKRVPVRRRASAEREAGSREAELQIWHQGSHNSNVEYRFSASLSRRDDSFAFFHRIDAVDGGNRDLFFFAPRPANFPSRPSPSPPPPHSPTPVGPPPTPPPL